MPALRLENYFYDRILVEANTDWPPTEKPQMGVTVNVEVGSRQDAPSHFRAIMDITGIPNEKGQPVPYNLKLRAQGFFDVDMQGGALEDAARLVQVTGASILYSAAREFVLLASSRGPFGSVLLPTVSFLQSSQREPAPPRKPRGGGSRAKAKPKKF
jgi:preprotein translocase subunit SecB